MPRASSSRVILSASSSARRHGGHPATGHPPSIWPSVSRRMSMSVPAVVSAAMVIIVFPPGDLGLIPDLVTPYATPRVGVSN